MDSINFDNSITLLKAILILYSNQKTSYNSSYEIYKRRNTKN